MPRGSSPTHASLPSLLPPAVLVWAGPALTSSWTTCCGRSGKGAESMWQPFSSTSARRGTSWFRQRSEVRASEASELSAQSHPLLSLSFSLSIGAVRLHPRRPGGGGAVWRDGSGSDSPAQVRGPAAEPAACWEDHAGGPIPGEPNANVNGETSLIPKRREPGPT